MKPKTCIRITGTRTGKLRARVEHYDNPRSESDIFYAHQGPCSRFEVTLGGERWKGLPPELQATIRIRASYYLATLRAELDGVIHASLIEGTS